MINNGIPQLQNTSNASQTLQTTAINGDEAATKAESDAIEVQPVNWIVTTLT